MEPPADRRPNAPPGGVTELLVAWTAGDRDAGNRLLPAIYDDLRAQAARAMRHEPAESSLDATGLVHEAYLRLVDQQRVTWQNRAHFFGVAAQVMRRILVDHARARMAQKRGGGAQRLTLGDADAAHAPEPAVDVLALHEALERLAALDPEQARLVELRYFGGLSIEETAETLGVSPATVKREWATARAWLRREIGGA
jgi:RNA polymerase sigma factor (TIGR02999 family)